MDDSLIPSMMRSSLLRNDILRLIKRLSPAPLLRWREAAYFRRYGEFELRLVAPLCDSDRDAIDVGANLGAYVHFMRRSSRLVYAFEPVPKLAAELTHKFPSRVMVRNMALSNKDGVAMLRVPLVKGAPEFGLSSLQPGQALEPDAYLDIKVTTARLDDIYDGDLGFVKIDVEGHEQAVLEGAVATMERCRPNLLIEIEERFAQGAIDRTRRFLEDMGYAGYFIGGGALCAIADFDPTRMQRSADIARFGAGLERTRFAAYVNNFIFIHHSDDRQTLRKIRALLRNERPLFYSGWMRA